MSLIDKDRRDKDIWAFVEEKLKKTINGETVFRYEAVLEMAREKFYLSTLQISRIHKAYEPPPEDPKQMDLFNEAAAKKKATEPGSAQAAA